MKHSIITLTAVIAITVSGVAVGQTQVPNTFQSGQPARATDVNANFDAVESAIDTNSTRIDTNETASQNNALSISQIASAGGISVYTQNGVELGKFLAMRRINSPDPVIYLLNGKGFVFAVGTSGDPLDYGETREIYYSGIDCTGDAYIGQSSQWLSDWGFNVGAIATGIRDGVVTRYYTERGGSNIEPIPYQSIQRPNEVDYGTSPIPGCDSRSLYAKNGWRAIVNDEAVTGVSNTPPVGPLVMGVPLP